MSPFYIYDFYLQATQELSTYLSPTYWPTDENKIPDLLDFFINNGISTTYTDIQASYDLTSDHTPIIATISTTVTVRQPPPRLHTSQTN
jgi:hypothetical protein